MISKKYIVSVGVIASMLMGASSLVFAETMVAPGTGAMPIVKMQENKAQEMVLQVGPKGEVLLRGTVKVIGATSLTVTSWGGDWVVNVSSSTKLMPGTDMSQFKVGDYAGVQGKISTTGSWTIDAKLVRDRSVVKAGYDLKANVK